MRSPGSREPWTTAEAVWLADEMVGIFLRHRNKERRELPGQAVLIDVGPEHGVLRVPGVECLDHTERSTYVSAAATLTGARFVLYVQEVWMVETPNAAASAAVQAYKAAGGQLADHPDRVDLVFCLLRGPDDYERVVRATIRPDGTVGDPEVLAGARAVRVPPAWTPSAPAGDA